MPARSFPAVGIAQTLAHVLMYALAAARALVQHSELDAAAIAREAMKVAAGICIYPNDHITVETL